MYILGITDGDDAGAVLLKGGTIVAAINEERLNRMKMSIGFPKLSISEVIRLGGIEPREIGHVSVAAYAEKFTMQASANNGWFQGTSTAVRIRNEISSSLAKPFGSFDAAKNIHHTLKRWSLGIRKPKLRNALLRMGIKAPITYHEHHRCHALSAFDTSGFETALSVSLDGGGDGCSSHIYIMDQNGEELINRNDSFDSIGNYYAYVTHLCGYRASIHEGKITGLSAHGEPIYKDIFDKLIGYRDGRIRNIGRLFFNGAISHLQNLLPQDWEHEDLAASIQKHLEDIAVQYVHYWMKKSGTRRICLSGGVFANVVLNQRIAELPECDEVFVFPAMGDGGLASGAAFSALRKTKGYQGPLVSGSAISHVYFGPEFTEKEMEDALWKSGVPFEKYKNIEEIVAQLVFQGKVVARFNGAMEYGPRALGNRSILYKTDEPEVNTWLNKRLNRTEFMPFAPICLRGHEDKLFKWNPSVKASTPYMTITQDCTEWMKQTCPAVVHIDGTARPQILEEETNPSMYRILRQFQQLTEIPVLVNTSFNMHEEPIVCSPEEAIRSYKNGQLDNLAIGPFLLGERPT